MAVKKIEISLDNSSRIEAQAPVIISASRSTDIPAFYSEWFFHRLERGYSSWKNPFNGVKSYISYKNTRLIVFWSKNPRPLLAHLDKLKKKNINTYIQFTLNDYEAEGLESGVPKLMERIDTFKRLVDVLGVGHVVWRNDPLILSEKITPSALLDKIGQLGKMLYGYNEKLVFSFIDINAYRKVKNNLSKLETNFREFSESEMSEFAKNLSILNQQWGYELATCGEKIDLRQFGIQKNRCIDDALIARLFQKDKVLMEHIGFQPSTQLSLLGNSPIPSKAVKKDKGQRETCGCVKSKDIGEYNTCPHLCEYCYANTSKAIAQRNYLQHQKTSYSDSILGE